MFFPKTPCKAEGLQEPFALQHARQLLLRHGRDANCWQITNPGMELWFTPPGDAVIGFVRWGNIRLVAGSPICSPERLPQVIDEFESIAAEVGQHVCFFATEAPMARLYGNSTSHSIMRLGAQPVWHPSEWPEMISHHASLRAQINRARNKGVSVSEWPIERALHHPGLHRCLDEWLASRRLPPLHFLVEPDTLGRLTGRRIFVAERESRPIGFLLASPVPRRNGWLIEQIVRGLHAPNGSAEIMLNSAMRALARDGSDYVTLGLAPLSRHSESYGEEVPYWLKLTLAAIRKFGNGLYNFEGLDAFKSKFQPRNWEPILAVINQPGFTLSALYSIAGAFCQGSPAATLWHAARGRVWQPRKYGGANAGRKR